MENGKKSPNSIVEIKTIEEAPIVEINTIEEKPNIVDLVSIIPGPKGDTGLKGEQGEEGSFGKQGIEGSSGKQGAVGLEGKEGPAGIQGLKGEQGRQGISGLAGPKGDQGEKGEQGPGGGAGPKGDKGPTGPRGSMGPEGPPPKHEVEDSSIRFELYTGLWGPWIDLGRRVQELGPDEEIYIPAGAHGPGGFVGKNGFVITGKTGRQGVPGPQNLFVQNTAPVTDQASYLWIQTGLGDDGSDCTIFVEDGI